MNGSLNLTYTDEANELLSTDAFALLIGMVLDQQIPLEKAFAGPLELRTRLERPLDVHDIAGMDPEELTAAFCQQPALHRFPAANATRVQKLAQIICDEYDGDAESVWTTAKDGAELVKRIKKLPGFGDQKAKIFVALLGKQLAIRPTGWREACAPFGDAKTTMSIADITDDKSLAKVREWKKAKKAAAKAAASEQVD